MRYRSAESFRQALLDHLRNEVQRTGQDFQWLLRRIAFERLLARLIETSPDEWLLKGGLALDFRLAGHARSTQDVDIAWFGDASAAEERLASVRLLDAGDYFALHVERTSLLDTADVDGAVRFRVECALARRHLAAFHLDVGFGRPVVGQPEALAGPTILAFSGIDHIVTPVLPLAQHVAEKVHAYSRQYGPDGRPSTRVKDLVDLVLIQANLSLVAGDVRTALDAVFGLRSAQKLPPTLPSPPTIWLVPFRRMAASLDIPADLDTGYRLAAAFLDPILTGQADDAHIWNPEQAAWVSRSEGGDRVTKHTAGIFREAGATATALTPAEEQDAFEAGVAADADRGAAR